MMGNQPQRIPPKPHQESVWDYPRPPRLEKTNKRLQVFAKVLLPTTTTASSSSSSSPTTTTTTTQIIPIADTREGYRMLETSHPPTYYFPRDAIDWNLVQKQPDARHTFCEFKGKATYYEIVIRQRDYMKFLQQQQQESEQDQQESMEQQVSDDQILQRIPNCCFSYHGPTKQYEAIDGYLSFYANVDGIVCFVEGEQVEPQPGIYYSGWITSDVVGPFKGGPNSAFW